MKYLYIINRSILTDRKYVLRRLSIAGLLLCFLWMSIPHLKAQGGDNPSEIYGPSDLNTNQVYQLGIQEDWGIRADIQPGGYVKVKVLIAQDPTVEEISDDNTKVLLSITANQANDEAVFQSDGFYVYDLVGENLPPSYDFALLDKNVNGKVLLDQPQIDPETGVMVTPYWITNEYKRAIARAYGWQNGFTRMSMLPNIKVFLEVEVKDAVLHEILIPGMEPQFFTVDHNVVIDVYSYNNRSLIDSYGRKDEDFTELSLWVGDSVVFKTNDPSFTVEGLKDVWLARSAGESKYYYAPERMGGYKPFLGFDSQVHGLALREHPDPEQKRYPAIEPVPGATGPDSYAYTYSWIAKGNVQSGLTPEQYDPTSDINGNIAFEKFKNAENFPDRENFPVGAGKTVVKQRNNQREGLNMELMQKWDPDNFGDATWYQKKWNEWSNWFYGGDLYKIVSGLDDDEIVLLENAASPSNPVGDRNFLQKETADWKELLEGETGDPIELTVNYYQRNRMKMLEASDPDAYSAWNLRYGDEGGNQMVEVLDQQQYQYDPATTGPVDYFNYKRPLVFSENTTASIPVEGQIKTFAIQNLGVTTVRYDEKDFNMKVEIPGAPNKAFYFISGETYPSVFQKKVPYSIDLSGISVFFRNKLVMEYTYENHLGHLEKHTRRYSLGLATDTWTEKFDIQGSGYHEITVYYQHSVNSERVIIAGKELLEVQLRFMSVTSSDGKLKESGAPGDYWYLRDFGKNLQDIKKGLYPEEYGRAKDYPYVLAQGDQLKFNIKDADPHTFLLDGVEFYQSERLISKKLTKQQLKSKIKWYISSDVKVWGDKLSETGSSVSHTFADPGTYYITAAYSDESHVTVQVIVKRDQYQYDLSGDMANAAEKPLGKVNTRALSLQEKDWLEAWAATANGGTIPDLGNIQLAEVGEVFSRFAFNEGPRAKKGIPGMTPGEKSNRYGPQSDYNANYEWSKTGGFTHDEQSILSLTSNDLTQLEEPYSAWFPSSWILHYMPGQTPKLIADTGLDIEKDESAVSAKIKAYFDGHSTLEPWQVRLPWVSQTQWKGFRTRTNIKTLNKLAAIFDNDNGAFSGNAWGKHEPGAYETYEKATNSVLASFNDLEKDRYDFYWDVLSGRIKLIHQDDLASGAITVKVKNPNSADTPTTFIAKYEQQQLPTDWMAGADMSSIPNLEAKGISWGYGSSSVDPYEIISDYGMNTVRFRLWVDPVYKNGEGANGCRGEYEFPADRIGQSYTYSQLPVVTDQIKRAKAKGLRVLLDLHISDTWTDPGANIIPEAWLIDGSVPPVDDLEVFVHEYVTETLQSLKDEAALPDYIQVGNETNGNILLSDEFEKLSLAQIASEIGVTEAEMNGDKFTINWDRNARLLNKGLEAVKQFNVANAVDVKTMIHIAGPEPAQWWLNQATTTTGRSGLGTELVNTSLIDYMGMSYYLAEKNHDISFSELSGTIEDIFNTHGLPTVIVETAFPRIYSYSDCSPNQMGQRGYRGDTWDDYVPGKGFPTNTSDNLQKEYLVALMDMLKSTPGGNGLLYWEPFWVGSKNTSEPTFDLVGSGWENMTFFTFKEGTPSEGLNVLAKGGGIEAFCDGNCPENLTGVVANKIVFLGNVGCSGATDTEKVNGLIRRLNPGGIATLGAFVHPQDCQTKEEFYASYETNFKEYYDNQSVFPVIGRGDYINREYAHTGTVGEEFWLEFFGRSDTHYSFVSGDVEFFVINTIDRDPNSDGNPVDGTDLFDLRNWLETNLHFSTKKYKIILGYHSPHLTAFENSYLKTWDFKAMGADMYISSGAAFYERHDVEGMPYVNVGLGGRYKDNSDHSEVYAPTLVPGTHYGKEFGVLSATIGTNMIMFQFTNVNDEKIDQFYLINRDDKEQDRVDAYYLENRRGGHVTVHIEEPLDVYLLLGQSNAEGRCESNYCYDEFAGDELVELSGTYLLNEKSEFEKAKNALARYSSVGKIQFTQSVGFGWTFAKTLNDADADQKIGIIANPVGGTDLAEWMPDFDASNKNYGKYAIGYGGENLYQETMRRVREAQDTYPNVNIKGIIWSQGENDAKRVNDGELNYAQQARALYDHFKTDLGNEDLLFLIPEVAYRSGLPAGDDWSHTKLNQEIHAMAALDPNIRVASVGGMSTFDGWENNTIDTGVHWDHDSYRTIGVRLANLILSPPAGARIREEDEVQEELKWSVVMYPNPASSGSLNLKIESPQESPYELRLVDLMGRTLLQSELMLGEGVNYTRLSVSSIASGTYIVEITNGVHKFTDRLVITH
ncbi:MAG: glycosyl hydrolase 53 family protein [Cyclobacteriaceae bacterium]